MIIIDKSLNWNREMNENKHFTIKYVFRVPLVH